MTASPPTPLVRLSALSLSRRVAPLLRCPAPGWVLATFTRSVYITLDGRIVVLADAQLLNGPLNLLLVLPEGGPFDHLVVGATITAQDGILALGEPWEIDTRQTPLWDPRLTPIVDDRKIEKRTLAAIAGFLEASAPQESLARARARAPRAERGMRELTHALRARDPVRAGRAAEILAGLGPGLTPSGDDVLAGVLLALAVLAPTSLRSFGERILAAVRGRTTRISESYLEAAAAGEAGEAWHRLVALLKPEQTPAEADLAAAVQRIMSFGETSGSDMLAGFILGMTELLTDQLLPPAGEPEQPAGEPPRPSGQLRQPIG